jgi:ornithine cyclodeaminase/alanine dehydrogenase-like protein (mu-crystallin family)
MRILSEQEVERMIEPMAAIDAMADAYRRHSAGLMPPPGRLDMVRQEPHGSVLVLAGHADSASFALKANMHVYPKVGSSQRKAASMLLLWDAVQCMPVALIATTLFNNHRTAAGLAAAAMRLAPKGAETLAVFGAGKIAPAAIRYLSLVRTFKRIFIIGRGEQRAGELAASLRTMPEFRGTDVRAITDPLAAVYDADVIVTLTTADTPVFPGRAVKDGALVILAGANRPSAREADDDVISRARIYLDHRSGCIERAGDIRIPLESGRLEEGQIVGELGELLLGGAPPSFSKHDVTVFKSIGIIAQDIALAEAIVSRASRNGVGIEFDPVTGACRQAGPALPEPSIAAETVS